MWIREIEAERPKRIEFEKERMSISEISSMVNPDPVDD